MIKLFTRQAARESVAKKEKNIADFIPYKCHWDENTILTKDNSLMQVIKVEGFSFETADDEDLDLRKNARNSLLKNMASGNITMYFHTIRRKKLTETDVVDKNQINPNSDFVTYMQKHWKRKNSTRKSFFNELYISVIYKVDTAGAAVFEYLFKTLQQKSDRKLWEHDMREMKESLDEASRRVINSFRDYGSRLLGVRKESYGAICEITEFLSAIVNCGQYQPTLIPRGNLDKYIASQRLFFGSKSIEARGSMGKRYIGIVSAQEYGPRTYAGMLDGFLQMPFSFVITQSFVFANRTVAVGKMQLQQNRMIQAEDNAVSQIAEISQALDLATRGDIGFGEHHMSIACVDDDLKTLENIISMSVVELSNAGIKGVRENINMEPCFWGQLPGNANYLVRKSTINTANMSSFASMHNYPMGKMYENHWGDYVTRLDTTSGTPFYFNFHVRDVGHTLIIGPTGGGKTVLMNFLCAQAQKFQPRTFFFDKDHGAEIFIKAIGGIHISLGKGSSCNLNPLLLSDNEQNRSFILEWLKILVTSNGEDLTSEDIKILNQAIEGNFRLKKQDRRLSNIVPFLGMAGANSLASRISMWHGKGSHARIFDNAQDDIDFNEGKVFGFEMGEILADKVSLPAVLLYIFHRINISLDGTRTMIILDEAWALIDNPVFAPKIKDWLKVLRKLNTFVVFATQSVEDASKSRISDTLVQQTATQIFLPNLKATEVYRKVFMLSQREYTLIKTTDPGSRYFLVKQGINAVVAKLNLAGMDDIINVLSGRAESVQLLQEIIKNSGENPQDWLPIFYKKVQTLT